MIPLTETINGQTLWANVNSLQLCKIALTILWRQHAVNCFWLALVRYVKLTLKALMACGKYMHIQHAHYVLIISTIFVCTNNIVYITGYRVLKVLRMTNSH